MLNAQQKQAIVNRREQINAAVSACIQIILRNERPKTFIPPCPLDNISPARWQAMIVHVWDNSDIYSPPKLSL